MADSTDGREYGICFYPEIERYLNWLEKQPPRPVNTERYSNVPLAVKKIRPDDLPTGTAVDLPDLPE